MSVSLRILPPSDRLLDEIESRACLYFFDLADPDTGLVLDRAALHQSYIPGVASIAATGFGLSALCIADQRHYLKTDVARARVRSTLRFLNSKAPREHGFLYHFLDSASGAPRLVERGRRRSTLPGCCAAYCIAAATGTILK